MALAAGSGKVIRPSADCRQLIHELATEVTPFSSCSFHVYFCTHLCHPESACGLGIGACDLAGRPVTDNHRPSFQAGFSFRRKGLHPAPLMLQPGLVVIVRQAHRVAQRLAHGMSFGLKLLPRTGLILLDRTASRHLQLMSLLTCQTAAFPLYTVLCVQKLGS